MNSRQVKAVIFDLDDTLIDWAKPTATREEFYRPRMERVYNFLLEANDGLPPQSDFYRLIDDAIMAIWAEAKQSLQLPSIGDVFAQVLAQLGVAVDQNDMVDILKTFDWQPWPGVVTFDDTLPVLSALRQRGYKIGLLTNSFLPMWMRDVELREYEIIDYLDARVTAADVGYIKPHPAIYFRLLEMLQTAPEQAVFVGDRPKNDIAGANAAGLISVLIDPPHLERELEGVTPDFTILCLSDLLPILDALERGA
jgi:putative hydrolase of the HAD superfamily